MMRDLLTLLLIVALPSIGFGAVVRPAPEFTFPAPRKAGTLRSLKGQAVVLLVADSPSNHAFRKELKYLRQVYSQYASRQVVFAAAFRKIDGPVKSDIPFVIANHGPAVAAAYGVDDDFQLIIIGKDGNIDYQTTKVCTGERVRDVIQNSFAVQAAVRK